MDESRRLYAPLRCTRAMKLILKTICLTLNQMVVMDEVSFQQEASATEFDWLCHKYPIAKTNDWVPIPKGVCWQRKRSSLLYDMPPYVQLGYVADPSDMQSLICIRPHSSELLEKCMQRGNMPFNSRHTKMLMQIPHMRPQRFKCTKRLKRTKYLRIKTCHG
ncbi:hypothetical protein C5167_011824 [Papaver somniferum]|nr:hypothetical protein C5167_011824 [Papaver somniferum]